MKKIITYTNSFEETKSRPKSHENNKYSITMSLLDKYRPKKNNDSRIKFPPSQKQRETA